MKVYIYLLTEPDGTPRYVGQTVSPRTRFSCHLSRGVSPKVRAWLDELTSSGKQPLMVILGVVSPKSKSDPNKIEADLIALLSTTGTLLNCQKVRGLSRRFKPSALTAGLAKAHESQAELARRLGVHRSTVARWARREMRPTPENAARIREALGVSICAQVDPADTPPPRSNPAAAAPSSARTNEPLSNSRANAQPRETTSAAAHSHSAHIPHCGAGACHTAQEIR